MVVDRTLRGQGVEGTVQRIQLFDGKFTTGYRLKRFIVTPNNPQDTGEISAVLKTQERAASVNWAWQSNIQVGWAAWNIPTSTRFGEFSLVDQEAIIVEDLWIDFNSGTADEQINYLIELEAVEFSDWKGALSMVQNRGQGDDDG